MVEDPPALLLSVQIQVDLKIIGKETEERLVLRGDGRNSGNPEEKLDAFVCTSFNLHEYSHSYRERGSGSLP